MVRLVRLRVGEEFCQTATKVRGLQRIQILEQLFLELPRYGDCLCEKALTRRGQSDSQDAPMLGSFPTFDESLLLERADQIDDGLRAHTDGTCQVGTRDACRLLEPEEQQELRWGQTKRYEGGFGAATDSQLGTLQQIDHAHGVTAPRK